MARRTNTYAAFIAIALLGFIVGILSAHTINLPPSGGSSPPPSTPPPNVTPPGKLTAHIFVATLPTTDPSNNHVFRVGLPTPTNGGSPCAGPGTFEIKAGNASFSLAAVDKTQSLAVAAVLDPKSGSSKISFDNITTSSSTFANQTKIDKNYLATGGTLVEYCVK